MRLFIACEIDEAIRSRLGDVIDGARPHIDGVKWVDHRNIHITLKFLGEVEDSLVDEVTAALDGALAGARAFALAVRGLGTFPPKGQPKVIWAGVTEGIDGLSSLNDAVERSLEPVGFEREKRPFSAHLTLARTRKKSRPRGVRELVDREQATEFGSQKAERITLMRSVLKPTGPIYTPVRTWNLDSA